MSEAPKKECDFSADPWISKFLGPCTSRAPVLPEVPQVCSIARGVPIQSFAIRSLDGTKGVHTVHAGSGTISTHQMRLHPHVLGRLADPASRPSGLGQSARRNSGSDWQVGVCLSLPKLELVASQDFVFHRVRLNTVDSLIGLNTVDSLVYPSNE